MRTNGLCYVFAIASPQPWCVSLHDSSSPSNAPRVQYRAFTSAVARATVSYHVYTPVQYDSEPTRRFPALYWLHGSGSGLAGVPMESMLGAGPLDLDFNGPRATGNPAERAQSLRDVYSDDMSYYIAQNPFTVAEQCAATIRGTPRALTRFRQVIGSLDFTLPANEEFRTHVSRLAIVQEYFLGPNVEHNVMGLFEVLGAR